MIPVLFLLLLLAFPSLSIAGAKQGLLLWSNVVLPTLAPFMICTQLITLTGAVDRLMVPFAPILRALFGLSPSGGYILLCGLLCGYPLGARMSAQYLEKGAISLSEARYLLSICNHPSPMFLLGYVSDQLSGAVSPALLLLSLYLPVIPLSRISRSYYHPAEEVFGGSDSTETSDGISGASFSLEELFLSACDTLVIIGGYIMLFSILAVWTDRLLFLSETVRALFSGIAEITTGIHKLCRSLSDPAPFVVCITAFGGFSGIFQTKSVIGSDHAKNAGLSIRHYLIWKLIHAMLSGITFTLLRQVPLP